MLNPNNLIVNRTLADVMAEDPGRGPVSSPRAPHAENLTDPVPAPSQEGSGQPGDPESAGPFDGLGLPHQAVTSLLAAGYDTMDKITEAGASEIQALPGVGPRSLTTLFSE